ncbi:MAG: hypothetical protein GY753_04765, partial [Gammaproteobacteria bacterium]|nr:hypothetical protein [Gammaproteobacteria bacterium]
LFTLSILFTLTISGGLVLALNTTGSNSTPEDIVAAAVERARAQTSYHVVADTQQTLIPKAVPSNVGKRDETTASRILGDISQGVRYDGLEDVRARLQFYAGSDQAPVEFVLADNEAFVGHQGRWQQIETEPGNIAPGGDYLGYLDAIKDVVETESANTAEGVFRRFRFTLDGESYAQLQLQRTERSMVGRIPQGVQLKPSPTLQGMTGQGEIWLDASGLPRRQILDVSMPAVTDSYDANMHMIVDYSRFGEPVPGIAVPQPSGQDGALVLPDNAINSTGESIQPPAAISISAQELAPFSSRLIPGLIALPLLALALLLIRRRRTLYVAVATTMIILMVAQPLLQVGQYAMFDRHSAEAAPIDEALQEMGLISAQATSNKGTANSLHRNLSPNTPAITLNDCHNLYVDAGSQPLADDDGDGLTNETEWCLGTDYTDVDSDGDSITDTLEFQGFTDANGKAWFSDPMQLDSNFDGVSDGDEWEPILTSDAYTGVDSFTDYDSDGVPNLWDADNDDDGVPDDQDISIYRVMPVRSGFEINVSSHNSGTAVYIDVQLQPEDTDHLRYSLTHLDWPADDKGQIKDLDNSTDDVALIPVLSLSSNISPTLATKYAIASSAIDAKDLSKGYSLWVPLTPVENSGAIYAFSARLAFTSDEADTGIDLTKGKIIWMAKAALDSCVADSTNSCTSTSTSDSVIASYEEEVRVTGLNVMETKDVAVGLFGTSAPR